jgi:methionyl-tRNA formyltransferase
MIPFMIENMPQPEEQIGDVVEFRRRTPEDGNIRDVRDTRTLYNVIRMLDGEGYPPAFLEDGCVKVEFSNAKEDGDSIVAMARISIRVPKL